ncbi:glycerate kinase [Prauserella muralis]|uniref:Glycerate kinase n=1 Tax=Prauserella muralis TaxID=588067 RepID=A0A2V4B350_9PSEU|nr:glycerate kinase [Prauserella muralis]PXY27575.1 glycerate kinase [Prauserella muralis]TWE22701.1 glycerate kinase [Prauserella muralis]
MRVVVAPDKFKGSLTAVEAAEAIAEGVRAAAPGAEVTLCPVADGGEGTLDVLLAAGGKRVDLRVSGPLSQQVDAWYVVLDGTAYLESARACGIEYVTPSPETALAAHTYGVGELMAHALAGGASRIVLTVGGTASTDGGSGMLRALGAVLRDDAGAEPALGGGPLGTVASVDLTAVRERLGGAAVRVATDVTNPLLGPEGAAAVFGPQKGAGPAQVRQLEASLRAWAGALERAGGAPVGDVPSAGAGGGVSGGAMSALAARAESGFELVVELTGVAGALPGAELAITGEGSLDRQSLAGKAPAGIAAMAGRAGVPVLAVAGRVALRDDELAGAGIAGSRALIDHARSLDEARRDAYPLLREQTTELVRDWLARRT